MNRKIIKSAIIIVVLVLSINLNSAGAYAKDKATPIGIKVIKNLSFSLKQNSPFIQPSQITAIMKDGSEKKLGITWDKQLGTFNPGTFTTKGTVKGYKNKVQLTLKVTNYVTYVDDLNLVINLKDSFDFPKVVNAIMSSGETAAVPVTWNSEQIDSSQVGVYTFVGKVEGYDKWVNLRVTVKSNIKTDKEIALMKNAVATIVSYDNHNMMAAFGSGFLVSKDGYAITCYHVIDGYQNVKVMLENGKRYDVDYVANYDKKKDIAILKLKDADNMPYLSLGNSDDIEVGEDMVAIGSPAGYQNTVSNGIISGKDRPSELRTGNSIQFTAGIASGSSGGAILNMEGEVIGMVFSTYSTGNLGMAVPSNEIVQMLASENRASLAELSPTTDSQKYEMELQKKYPFFTYGNDSISISEIYLDVFDDDNEVDLTINYHDGNLDDFNKKIYSQITNNSDLKKAYEDWLKKIFEDVKAHYPKMDIYGIFNGLKISSDKPDDKVFNYVSLDKITGNWNGFIYYGTFFEKAGKDAPADSTEKVFQVTWKSLSNQKN